MSTEPPLGYQLTASQVAYLKTRVDEYRVKKKKATKERVAVSCARALKDDYEQLAHQSMSSEMEKLLKKAVAQWLETNALSTKGAPKRVWGIRWHPRLVFQSSNNRSIMFLARILASGPNPNLPNLRDLYEDPDTIIPADESITEFLPLEVTEDPSESDDEDDGVQPTPFSKYQTATSLLWGVLTESERAEYAAKAEEWKLKGPPLEEQLRCADRFIRPRCMEFALALHNDMDARVWMLIGFRNLKKEPIAVPVDFNRELGGCDTDFSNEYAEETEALVENWRDWITELYNGEPEGEGEGSNARRGRVRGKALLTLECDDLGRPLLPPLSAKPPKARLNTWLGDVFRSYFTRYYVIHVSGTALPEVVPPNSGRPSAPWAAIATLVNDCFDEECIDKDLWPLFKDPAHMKVGPQMAYYNHFFQRQEDPSIDEVFRFKLAPVRSPRGEHPSNNMTGYDLVPKQPPKQPSARKELKEPKRKSSKGKAAANRSRRHTSPLFEGFSPPPAPPSSSPSSTFQGFSPPPQLSQSLGSSTSFSGFSPPPGSPNHDSRPSPSLHTEPFLGFSPAPPPASAGSMDFGGFSPPPGSQGQARTPFGGFSPPPGSQGQARTPFGGFSPPPGSQGQARTPSQQSFHEYSPPPSPLHEFSPPPGSDDSPSTPPPAGGPSAIPNPTGRTPWSSRVPRNISSGLQALPDEILQLPRTTRGAARKRAMEDELPQPPKTRPRGRRGRRGSKR